MMDGFSQYSQVFVYLGDQKKKTFTTPWGMFMYARMPFGLINVGATFQREMGIDFVDEIGHCIVIYIDDIMVFSNIDEEHLAHLRRVFEKCRKIGISLNPKKILFGLEKGKLLGHIISKDGIRRDPSRIEAILKISHPINKRNFNPLLEKIIF